MESILTSIKKLLGIDEDYEYFDTDIILHINSTLNVLNQLGIGPEEGFKIESKTSKWTDFVPTRTDLELLKTYVYLKVRLLFDPPQTGYLVEALKRQCTEMEWRLNVLAEGGE